MFRCLSPGAIGIGATLQEGLDLAARSGFQGLEVNIGELADLIDKTSADDVKALFEKAGIRPGGWGPPTNWRTDEATLTADLKKLPRLASAAQQIGCTRASTWLLPGSDELAFTENFARHKARLSPFASILGEYGSSFGLEFIGPKTMRSQFKHEFIYTMDGMLELAAACGPNVGLLLDCWHWYTSGGTVADLGRLKPENVVYVHVNDAPSGVALDEQIDSVRRLPGATGVIDIVGFLQALRAIGYDGPITPEPFVPELGQMPAATAARVVGEAMAKVWNAAGLA